MSRLARFRLLPALFAASACLATRQESSKASESREAQVAPLAASAAAPTQISVPSAKFAFIVVDGVTDAPIADAEVRWAADDVGIALDDSILDQSDRHRDRQLGAIAKLEARVNAEGYVARSGIDGRVVLPVAGPDPLLVVRNGNLFGSTGSMAYPTDKEPRLSLWPDGDLRVRAIDSEGHAIENIGVLLMCKDFNATTRSSRQRAQTGIDGMATLPHALVTIAWISHFKPSRVFDWSVELEGIPANAGSISFDPKALPEQPIEIALPPSGEVELELREPDGRPARLEFPVLLAEIDPGEKHNDPGGAFQLRPDRWEGPGELRAYVVDGKAVIRNIGLGRQLIAHAARNDSSQVSHIRFAGPTRAGERVKVSLVIGGGAVIFTGRVLDPEGRPLKGTQLRVEHLGAPSFDRPREWLLSANEYATFARTQFSTDEQGRFCIEFRPEDADGGPPMLVISQIRTGVPTLDRRLDVPDQWAVGVHDLGDVRLELAPLVAAGVVVDSEGAPLVDVEVHTGSNRRPEIGVRTNELGQFELRTSAPHPTFDIFFHKPGYAFCDLSRTQNGKADLRMVLEREGELVAHVRLPPGVQRDQTNVVVTCTKRMGMGSLLKNYTSLGSDGLIKCDDCAPGIYQLSVLLSVKTGYKRIKIEGIVVRPGETTDLGWLEFEKF